MRRKPGKGKKPKKVERRIKPIAEEEGEAESRLTFSWGATERKGTKPNTKTGEGTKHSFRGFPRGRKGGKKPRRGISTVLVSDGCPRRNDGGMDPQYVLGSSPVGPAKNKPTVGTPRSEKLPNALLRDRPWNNTDEAGGRRRTENNSSTHTKEAKRFFSRRAVP